MGYDTTWGQMGQWGNNNTPTFPQLQMPGAPQNMAIGSPDVPQMDLAGAIIPRIGGGGYGDMGTNYIPDYANPVAVNGNSWMPDWLKGAVGTKDNPGWGGLAVGTASSLLGAYMGMKQYGLARDTLNFNKDMFQKNYDAQRGLTNSSLADRQAGRIAAAGPNSHYQSVGDYMNQYGVKA